MYDPDAAPSTDPTFAAATRRRDLLLTLVMLGIAFTPAWLLPTPLATPWLWVVSLVGAPAVFVSWMYAPWVPTPASDFDRILACLDLQPGDAFCDLGAGDGRMLTRVHGATGARCTGIEISPALYLLARLRLAGSRAPLTQMRFGDLHRADLSQFDVLYVWGTAYWVGQPAFGAFVASALKPGARLVSYHYPVGGIPIQRCDNEGERPIFVYVFGGSGQDTSST